jgi:hypothetical protein
MASVFVDRLPKHFCCRVLLVRLETLKLHLYGVQEELGKVRLRTDCALFCIVHQSLLRNISDTLGLSFFEFRYFFLKYLS